MLRSRSTYEVVYLSLNHCGGDVVVGLVASIATILDSFRLFSLISLVLIYVVEFVASRPVQVHLLTVIRRGLRRP